METALIYDEEMTKHHLLWEDPICKIEVPERLKLSYEALVKKGLADRCVSVPVREATEEEILLVHSEEYLENVKKTPHMSVEELKVFTLQYGDVYFHPNTYHCAKLAVGATLQLVDSVMTGKVRNGIALVRPPGHHSMHSTASGFCVFNNVSIGAQYAKKKYGVERVLIVDWDIHHGQGVQYCFEEDPSVLYFSWHRFEHQKFWPNLRDSEFDCVGKGKGAGFNMNVPWNQVGMTNGDYFSIFCHALLPVAYEFCPELVLVCAGFDSAIGDPEGEMCATPDVFAHLTHLLMNLAGGKVCAVLEGGYNLTALPQSVCQTVQTLLGDPLPRPANLSSPCRSALESLQCVRWAHRPYWSCLRHAADLPSSEISTKNITSGEEKEREEQSREIVWPEPPERFSSPIWTAALLPDDVVCPDGCQRFTSSGHLDPLIISKTRETFLTNSDDCDDLRALSDLLELTQKMVKNEICNGLVMTSDITMAMTHVLQLVATPHNSRVLLVCVGEGQVFPQVTEDGTRVVVHIGNNEMEDRLQKYYIPVCLKKGCSDPSGFLQAVFGLLLPLGYEYDPSLVLLVRMPGSRVLDSLWQQLTGLLQSFAQGHTLVLIQEEERACIRPTVWSLLGAAAPPLEPLEAPLMEDVEALERLRHRLQADWRLLQNTVDPIAGTTD